MKKKTALNSNDLKNLTTPFYCANEILHEQDCETRQTKNQISKPKIIYDRNSMYIFLNNTYSVQTSVTSKLYRTH